MYYNGLLTMETQCPYQLWEGLEENISSLNAVRQTLYNFVRAGAPM